MLTDTPYKILRDFVFLNYEWEEFERDSDGIAWQAVYVFSRFCAGWWAIILPPKLNRKGPTANELEGGEYFGDDQTMLDGMGVERVLRSTGKSTPCTNNPGLGQLEDNETGTLLSGTPGREEEEEGEEGKERTIRGLE